MFTRTPRLLLRPGFPEDAPALAAAIADEAIVRNLASVPWPYGMRDAEAYLARQIKFDSDIWIIEVEDRAGRNFLDTVVA